ncbi:MAG: hypothetical protein KDA80_19800, partial [Planctomycetaceae bacterium]|nr:hypothetical protein [Planctomycetaceae bacterium]
ESLDWGLEHFQETFCVGFNDRDEAIRRTMKSSENQSFENNTLEEIARLLSEQWQVDVWVDTSTYGTGWLPDERADFKLSDRYLTSGSSTFELLNDRGIVVIADTTCWEERSTTVFQEISDVRPQFLHQLEFKEWVQRATSGPWREIDAIGGDMNFFRRGELMMVHQTSWNQDEIREQLDRLRELVFENPQWRPSDPVEFKAYDPPKGFSPQELKRYLRQVVAPETWRNADDQRDEDAVVGAILLLERTQREHSADFFAIPSSPSDPQSHSDGEVHSRLLVRQRRSVQFQIREALRQLADLAN